MTAQIIINSLQYLSDANKARSMQGFFKTGKGEYAEGDIFWGIIVPKVRQVASIYYDISLKNIKQLIKHPVHEVRLCALLILVEQFKKGSKEEKDTIVDFYLSNIKYVNNWDLVDLSCYHLLGKYLMDKPKDILYKFARSSKIWKQRIAIVSTLAFIRSNDFEDALALSEMLLKQTHPLTHKATGWILREIGKYDESRMIDFLKTYYEKIPRTVIRCAIEKLPEKDRKNILKGKFEQS
ncbi:MAG: DNA alkylation repair protein [Bacteroidales bacterium]|jgi:3-methyladenine DNA glycosylase AlkD|nr:DNA alkylation repair protein [Bacteroidales bacterium]